MEKPYIPDPANYVMKGANAQPREMPAQEVLPVDLGKLSKQELIALCERMARQCGLVAGMTDEETAQAMLDMLAHTALKPIAVGLNMRADIQARLAAIDKWLDRKQGKPLQQIAAAIKSEHAENVNINDPESLLDLARRMEFIMAKARHIPDIVSTPKLEHAKEPVNGQAIDVKA